MKSLLPIAIFLELAFAIWLATSFCFYSNGLVRAAHAVKEHPTSEVALAEFHYQQQLAQRTPVIVGTLVFGVLLLPHAVAAVVRRNRRDLRSK